MCEDEKGILLREDDSKSRKCQSTIELSECLKSSVRKILNHVTNEQFVSIFKICYKEFEKKDQIPRPALSGSSVEAKKYYSQFNDMIIKSTDKTIEETIYNMDEKLQELEELKLAQLDNNVYWRPPGNVSEHMVPFEYISEMEKKKELENKIERVLEELSILKKRVLQKRKKAKELKEILESSLHKIKSIVTSEIKE